MYIEVKYYKQYDLDLIGLREAGYPIGDMIKKSLIAYANGTPIKFKIDKYEPVNISDIKSFRCRMDIKDANTINLLKNIRPRFRNSFCKMLLRESLDMQNLSAFYTKNEYIAKENERINNGNENYIFLNSANIKKRHIEYQNNMLTRAVFGENSVPKKNMQLENRDAEIDELKKMVMALSSQIANSNANKRENETINSQEIEPVKPVVEEIAPKENAREKVVEENFEKPKQNTDFNVDTSEDLMSMFDGLMND